MFTFMYTYSQERYWPHLLDQMRKDCLPKVEKQESNVDSGEAPEGEGTAPEGEGTTSNGFDCVLLKSDYWKKFEGTVIKEGLGVCEG